MPELPEVETVVSELNRKLKRKKIKRVEIRLAKMISVGPKTVSNVRSISQKTVDEFCVLVQGQIIESVKRRGKMLIFNLSGSLSLLVHLKMTGQFIFEDESLRKKTNSEYKILNRPNAPLVKLPCKFTHVIFYFTDESRLFYNDTRQFGYLRLVKDEDISKVKEFLEYGPEPLGKNFTLHVLEKNLSSRKKLPIKLALMDVKIVAGIGNIYSDEILFHAGVLPSTPVSTLSQNKIAKIFAQIAPVLKTGIKYKGSSVGDFVRTDGKFGTMGKYHFVYGRKNQECLNCATIIKSIKLGGRTSSFCPKCQK